MARTAAILPDREGAGGFVVLVTAALVFLAALSVLGALALQNTASSWSGQLSGVLTIEIPAGAANTDQAKARRAAAVLRATAGVVKVRILPQSEVLRLLEPWIGKSGLARDLPIPTLIDIRLDPERPADIRYLERRLRQVAPNAVIDDHDLWLNRLHTFADGVTWLAATVVVAIIILVVAVIAFSARVSLSAHRDIVETLHLIGAHDGFIAAHFQRRAFRRVLQGAIAGLLLASVGYFLIAYLFAQVKTAMIGSPSLMASQAVAMILLPPIAAGIAAFTSRVAVLRALRKML